MFKFHIRGKKTVKIIFLKPSLPVGAPLFLYDIRGKNGKNRKILCVYLFYRGGAPFSSTISAVKTVNFIRLPFLPGGRSFFFYLSAVKTIKIMFLTFFPARSGKDTP